MHSCAFIWNSCSTFRIYSLYMNLCIHSTKYIRTYVHTSFKNHAGLFPLQLWPTVIFFTGCTFLVTESVKVSVVPGENEGTEPVRVSLATGENKGTERVGVSLVLEENDLSEHSLNHCSSLLYFSPCKITYTSAVVPLVGSAPVESSSV